MCPGLGSHTFRHEYATMLYYSGIDIMEAVEIMGHSNSKMLLDTYAELRRQEGKSIQKLNDFAKKSYQNNASDSTEKVTTIWLHFDYTFPAFYTFSHCFRRFLCIRKIAVSERKNTGNPWFYWISGIFSVKLEKGLEPSTPSLRVKCSTDWAIPASVSSIAADSNYYTWLLSVLQVFSQK